MSGQLSREEIAALMSGLGQGLLSTALPPASSQSQIQSFELTASQEKIFRGRLPGLEHLLERYARCLRASLSAQLGRSVLVTPGSVQTLKFGAALKRLPLPSSLHLFRMPPLPGTALLIVSTPLAYAVVETLMGGIPGKRKSARPEGREFSPIETRLIGKFVSTVLEDWQNAWVPICNLECRYTSSEFNPLAVNIAPQSDHVVLATLDVNLEGETAPITLCLPSLILQPVKDKLSSGMQQQRPEFDASARSRMDAHIRQTELEVRVRLGTGGLKVRDFLTLAVGDHIALATAPDEPAKVLVEGKEKFKAHVGSSGGRKAARVL